MTAPAKTRKRKTLQKSSRVTRKVRQIKVNQFLAIDTETTGSNFKHGCRVFAVSACDQDGEQWYWEVPVNPLNRKPRWTRRLIQEIIDVVGLYNTIVFHNSLFDLKALGYLSKKLLDLILTKEIHDTMILAHVLDSKRTKKLKELAVLKLGILDDDEKELDATIKHLHFKAKKLGWDYARLEHPHFPGAKSKFHKMDMWLPRAYAESKEFEGTPALRKEYKEVCSTYAIFDAIRTSGLFHIFIDELNQEPESIEPYLLQLRVIKPLLAMEDHGLSLKEDEFFRELEEYQVQKDGFLRLLQKLLGKADFNPDSTDQLKEVLFEDLEFEPTKLTKTGNPSTDKEVLNDLRYQETNLRGRRFLSNLMLYRATNSALKYLRSYERFQLDGTLYPNMNIVGTSTTRLSSQEPNGQNVSKGKEVKDADGNELRDSDGNPVIEYSLRRVFGPTFGRKWFAIDYDQLQIRIFAYLSQEQSLIRAIQSGFDFHTTVAKDLFEVEEPTKSQRKTAKYINFGIIFGAGEAKIDHLSGVQGSYRRYTQLYPNVADYISQTSSLVRKQGFIRTASGYPLTVPKHKAYAGVNYKVQGTEGDIVKLALANTYDHITHFDLPINIILQVHDEFLFDCPEHYDFPVEPICKIMEDAGSTYGVPCKAKPEIILDNWSEPQDYWKYEETQIPF